MSSAAISPPVDSYAAMYDGEVVPTRTWLRYADPHANPVASFSGWSPREGARRAVEVQLLELSALRRGWDSYGALPPTPTAITRAGWVVQRLRDEGVVPPTVAPSTDGGVRVEWGDTDRELTIEVGPHGEISTYCFDATENLEYEGPLTDPENPWARVLSRISEGPTRRFA